MTVKLSIPASLLMAADMSYSGSVGRQTIGSLGSSEDSTTGSLKKPTFSERHPKAIRSITVIGYLFCVSLAAILLSAYYVVFWQPTTRDPQKSTMHGNATLPCRGGGGYHPTENGGGTYLHPYQRFAPNNKRMKSPFYVYVGAPSAQQQAPVIPEPSKLVSPAEGWKSLERENSRNNSLSQNNRTSSGHTSLRDNNTSSSSATFTIPDKYDEFQAAASSESVEEDETASSTLVPSQTSTSPNSIIIQKLLQSNKNGFQQQKEYT